MEELDEAEKISTENDRRITITMVMKMNWMMTEPEELDAADILMQLSGSVSHSGRSDIDSPGAGSKSSSYSVNSFCGNKGDESYNKLGKISKYDDEESFCATPVVGDDCRERLSLSSFSSSSFRTAELQKRDLVDDDDEHPGLIEMGCGEIEGYPLRRKRKFRSILDLYAQTEPFPYQPVVTSKKSKTRQPRRPAN